MTTTDTNPAELLAAEAQKRTAYTAGLRALADVLDAHPEVPLPYDGTTREMSLFFLDGDAKAEMAAAVRAFPGQKDKQVTDGYYNVSGTLHGLRYKLTAFRDAVCERVVKGTREITREVPDREALAAVPTKTVTETVEDVEWVCRPLLADESVSA